MDSEYLVVITAVTGFASIVITALVNYDFRRMDYHIKQREQTINTLENFYLPLTKHLNIFQNNLQSYMKTGNIQSLVAELAGQQNTNGENILAKSNLEKCVNDISQLILDKKTCINDYISSYYYNVIDGYISSLKMAMDKNIVSAPPNFNIDVRVINRFIKRINSVYIKVFQKNTICSKIYFGIWRCFHKNN